MVANERLRDACEAWLQASLMSLRGKQVALNTDLQVVWTSEQAMTVVSIETLAPSRLLADYGDVLMTLPELAALIRVVQESAQTANALLPDAEASALSPPEVAASLFRSHLETFLIAYLKHARPSHAWEPTDVLFVPERFDRIYAQFEQFIYNPAAIEAWWLYQFGNLSMEVDAIPLSPDARLRRSIQVERDQAVIDHNRQGYSRLKASWFDLDFVIPEAVLEVRRTLPSRSAESGFGPEDYEASHQIAQALLLALRLLKAEPVRIESFQTRIDNPFADPMMFSELPRYSLPWGQPMMLAFASQYVIKSEDLGKLESLWRQAQSALRDPLLTVPLKRLDDSYLRTDLADRLIDSWIALEGLFLPEKYVREMADVAAEAIAHYLGKTVSERASTATLVRSSHAMRSKVIHGKHVANKDLEEMVVKTGDLLRRALQQRLAEY